jgi:hypothetical protein
MGSIFEGFIWEYYLAESGISTMHIFGYAAEQGVELLPIYDYNYDEQMAKLSFLSSSTKADIQNAVNSGYCVLIPESEITMNDWSGTGYLIADLKNYDHFVYRISGGLNGGGGSFGEPLDNVISKGLTEEFFNSIGADYDDYFCELFGIGQIIYGILEIRTIVSIADSTWGIVRAANMGSIGEAIVSTWETCEGLIDYAEVVSCYTDMLDSILLYAGDEPIEGVQLLTKTVLSMLCELTGVAEEDVAVIAAEVLGVAGFVGIYGTATLDDIMEEYFKDAFKELLTVIL